MIDQQYMPRLITCRHNQVIRYPVGLQNLFTVLVVQKANSWSKSFSSH